MQIYHSLTVDVAKRNQYKAVSAKQLDCNSRFLKIELQNNGSAFDIPNNVTIAMAVARNGETKAFNCKYEGDYIVAPLDTWILQESGYVDCEIILLDTETNSKLSSFLFSLEIEQNIYNDEDIKSDENYDLLLTLIGDVKSSQIVSITEKVEGLKHTYTVLFGNGESKEFVISDGAKGDPGTPGKDGAPGKDGTPGKDGYTPIKGVDYFDGAKGEKGDKGDPGKDYVLTDEDLQKISTLVDAPPEVYIGSEQPQGNEKIWVDDSTTAENILATKAYVDEVFRLITNGNEVAW